MFSLQFFKPSKGRYLLLIVLSLFFISWHPYFPNIDKNNDNLKGNVKQVIERVNSWGDEFIAVKDYNRNGKLIQIKMYGLSDFDDSIIMGSLPDSISGLTDTNKLFLIKNTTFRYSQTGKLSEYTVYTKNGNFHKTKYQFNSKDSLSSIIEFDFENGKRSMNVVNISHTRCGDTIIKSVTKDQKTIKTTKFVLNPINQVIEMIETDYMKYKKTNECTKFTYNELGKVVKISTYSLKDSYYTEDDEDKKDISNLFFIYDANGNLVKEYQYRNDWDLSTGFERTKIYNENGIKTTEIYSYIFRGEHRGINRLSFNSNFDLTKAEIQEFYDDKNGLLSTSLNTESFKYKYDHHGNWIVRDYYQEEKHQSSDERIIMYYDE